MVPAGLHGRRRTRLGHRGFCTVIEHRSLFGRCERVTIGGGCLQCSRQHLLVVGSQECNWAGATLRSQHHWRHNTRTFRGLCVDGLAFVGLQDRRPMTGMEKEKESVVGCLEDNFDGLMQI